MAFQKAGRYSGAEPLFFEALRMAEQNFGKEHQFTAITHYTLAILYKIQGRYADAEPHYKRSLEIWEKVLGPDHPDVALSINNLALLYYRLGRYADAEPLYKRSLEINENVFGADHPEVATSLNNLAELYRAQGRYADAEPLYKRSLTINEKALGPDHPSVGTSLNNLANLYSSQGRYADAEPLLKRALVISEKALGPDRPSVATSLNNLALLYHTLGRHADAEPLYKRALTISEKALGPDHPSVAMVLNNLALLYHTLGRYADAEPLYKRTLAISEKALGPDHPEVATSLSNLASLYKTQGRYADAEPFYKRALAINEKALGPDHPDVATILSNLASLYHNVGGGGAVALDHIRRASVIHGERAAHSAEQRSGGGLSEQKNIRYVFVQHARYAWNSIERDPERREPLTAEAFEAAQLAHATSTAAAVAGMGARFATGNDAMGRLVRQHQDAAAQWQRLDKKLIAAVGLPRDKRVPEAEKRLRAQLGKLDRRIKGLDSRLFSEFPEYVELASPRPTSLEEIQELLGPREALLAYMVAGEETLLWVVRRDDAQLFSLEIGQEALDEAVVDLRIGLDPSLTAKPAFDTTQAFKLYNKIFAAAEPLLEGVRHVFVALDGPLQSIPLGVLVTKKPQKKATDFASYLQTPWLAKRYAMTTLPSVSSLKALRTFAKAALAPKPFMGFGDPLLQGHPGKSRGIPLKKYFKPQGGVDVEMVRTGLAPLPETADELSAMAKSLGARKSSLFLRERATETTIKSTNLSDIRVLAFATHGLVAGDLGDLAEPALVLTPPKKGTRMDDGLLTASEVATLKLNSDLVILSACNTAASDGTPNADALSGLAKAFFYAGSRSLLVSHWPVLSDAAVKLTTRMLKEIANDNKVGRAEALRRSMVALMEDEKYPEFAHPAYWAPFVVVGEGGGAR